MNRRRADLVVGLLVATLVAFGGLLTWEATQRRTSTGMDSMMGSSMEAVHGTNPLWFTFGTILVAVAIGGGYFVLREDLAGATKGGERQEPSVDRSDDAVGSASTTVDSESTVADGEPTSAGDESTASVDAETQPRSRVLDLLPEDERRILDPVLTSPGLTQIELRDRSDFSKSKVSQTVSSLEKRGLLYRERQGRTYRIYPSDELAGSEP